MYQLDFVKFFILLCFMPFGTSMEIVESVGDTICSIYLKPLLAWRV